MLALAAPRLTCYPPQKYSLPAFKTVQTIYIVYTVFTEVVMKSNCSPLAGCQMLSKGTLGVRLVEHRQGPKTTGMAMRMFIGA
jgi:hypothetical protein